MKRYKISIVLACLLFSNLTNAQQIDTNNHIYTIQPNITLKLLNKDNSLPIVDAKVIIKELGLEAFSDETGNVLFQSIPQRNFTIIVEHGDYIIPEFIIDASQHNHLFEFSANQLNLGEVVLLGKESNSNGTTSTVINRKAIEHLQATSLQEVLQLVPGNMVTNPNFNNANQASIRQYSTDKLGSLGTSVIVNGASLSNNANLQVTNSATAGTNASFSTSSGGGADLRQINADNIESVEVIRGIPSVEYGDLNSGAIIVQTKARKEPLQLNHVLIQQLLSFGEGKDLI